MKMMTKPRTAIQLYASESGVKRRIVALGGRFGDRTIRYCASGVSAISDSGGGVGRSPRLYSALTLSLQLR
jgi:hypothetical protein